MATLNIRKFDGSPADSLELKDSVFGIEPNAMSVRAAVNQFLANQRLGTHSTKTRSTVRGGGRKPFRQKGTGRARQGSIRATQWRGGAIAFGPHPRDYSYKINRKVKALAFRSLWSDLIQSERLLVVENFKFDQPRTRLMADMLDKFGVSGRTLVVTEKTEENVALSARNIPWVKPLNADNLNVYDLAVSDWVVVTPEVLKRVEEMYA